MVQVVVFLSLSRPYLVQQQQQQWSVRKMLHIL